MCVRESGVCVVCVRVCVCERERERERETERERNGDANGGGGTLASYSRAKPEIKANLGLLDKKASTYPSFPSSPIKVWI